MSHTIERDLAKKLPHQNSKQTSTVHRVTLQGMKDIAVAGASWMTEIRVFILFAVLQ